MSSTRKLTASYTPHKQSGRGRVVWYDVTGTRRQKLLPGPYNSPESRTAFARFQLELEVSPASVAPTRAGITVAEVLVAYLDHAEKHYRHSDGTPTSEVGVLKVVIRALRELYAETPAAGFGPIALKTARQQWVKENLARTECNRRVRVVRRIFKWATSEELVPPSVYQGLCAVDALKRGRTIARETVPVGPVDDPIVDATLAHLNRHVAGMVELQRMTGCRPGEACTVRRTDLDTGGTVWLYRPPHHKTTHYGKTRVIAIGPRAQLLLKGFFTSDINDYLFSPRRAVEELRAERSARRKTPKYPSHMKRNAERKKTNPVRRPAEKYRRTSYTSAVRRACDKARVTRWHPNQLRHTFATQVRKQYGLEAVQVLLGHSRADVTQVYAERNEGLAATVAAEIG